MLLQNLKIKMRLIEYQKADTRKGIALRDRSVSELMTPVSVPSEGSPNLRKNDDGPGEAGQNLASVVLPNEKGRHKAS